MSGKRITIIVCSILIAIILIAAIVLFVAVKSYLHQIKRFDGTEETLSSDQIVSMLQQTEAERPDFIGPSMDANEVTGPTAPVEQIVSQDDIVHVLLVGQDRREGEGRRHSDSMVLVSVNKTKKTITMTSFMRDLWVYIPDHYYERLNVPYMLGGFPLLNDTLEYTFGVRADHNIEVDFEGFEAVIEAVGGVDIYLTAAEANYLNSRGNWTAGDNYQGDWNLQKGVNHLTGLQALAYSRIRDLDSDFGRTGRQRIVLEALIDKAKTMGATELLTLVNNLIPLVRTDMTDSEILSLAADLIPMLSDMTVVSQRIPVDDGYVDTKLNDDGIIKYVLTMTDADLEENIRRLKETLGG